MSKKEWILAAGILLATFFIFLPVTRFDFVDWDDDSNITLNENIRELNGTTVRNLFSSTVTGGYTPLTSLSFALEYKAFGLKPGLFHLDNLLLHLLVTLLVLFFMRRLGASPFVSFAVMILFAMHPMRVESVAWVTERKDVLFSLFFLASLLFYMVFYRKRRPVYYGLALAAFSLSLLSKIQAVSLPLVLLLIDYFYEGNFRFRQLWNKIPFFILSLATGLAGILILQHQGTLETGKVLPFVQRIFIGTWTLCIYLVKSVIPYRLSAIYPNPDHISFLMFASALAIIGIVWAIVRYGRKYREIIFGSLFFLVNVIFVLQIVGAGQAYLADRFTYIPYIGIFFMIAWGIDRLASGRLKIPVLILAGTWVAVLGAATAIRVPVWKNTETLFTDVVRKYPQSAMAYNNLGIYYSNLGKDSRAIEAYTHAVKIHPDSYVSLNNRGEVYFKTGQEAKALDDMDAAIRLNPNYVKALVNRGAVLGSRGDYHQALNDLDKAIGLEPDNLSAWLNKVLVGYSSKNFEQAGLDATSYLKLDPENADMYNLRGLCYQELNRNQEALNDYNRAIQMNPRAAAYYQNRSALWFKTGNRQQALQDLLKARDLGGKINPDYLRILQSKD
jgi:tetratricopeptide (TPR) repeat protein